MKKIALSHLLPLNTPIYIYSTCPHAWLHVYLYIEKTYWSNLHRATESVHHLRVINSVIIQSTLWSFRLFVKISPSQGDPKKLNSPFTVISSHCQWARERANLSIVLRENLKETNGKINSKLLNEYIGTKLNHHSLIRWMFQQETNHICTNRFEASG